MKKFLIPIGLFVLLGIILAIGLRLDPRLIPSPLVDKPLPGFNLPRLEDPSKTISHTDLRGRVVLINVWASWCAACKEEHPLLMALAREQNIPIIGLNYKDERDAALAVLKKDGNPYAMNLMDASGRTGIDWGVYGVPETFLLDKDGVIRYKHIGPFKPDTWKKKFLPVVSQLTQ